MGKKSIADERDSTTLVLFSQLHVENDANRFVYDKWMSKIELIKGRIESQYNI